MYHILTQSQENIIGLRIEGFLRAEDCKTLLPFIERKIIKHGAIRILSDLRDFRGIKFRGVLKAFPFAFKYSSRIDKKAVVTDQRWIYTWVKLLTPFFKTEIHCFPTLKEEEAWEWVKK